MTYASHIAQQPPVSSIGVGSGGELPAELAHAIARLGPGLVVMVFTGTANPRHLVLSQMRQGNLPGQIARELVAANAGSYVTSLILEDFLAFIYRAPDPGAAVPFLQAGAARRGLARHAQIFSLAAPGSPVIAWPRPANKHRSPAHTLSPENSEPSPSMRRRAYVPSLRNWKAIFQRVKTEFARMTGFLVCLFLGKPSPLPPAVRHDGGSRKSTDPGRIKTQLLSCNPSANIRFSAPRSQS